MTQLDFTYVDISILKPRAKNPRTHSKKQIAQIAESIRRFGFLSPLIIESDGTVICGHGRLEAAKLAGLSQVPVVCADHLTRAQLRAYIIADNKIAENAGWDKALLALELEELRLSQISGLSLGFAEAELDALAASLRGTGPQSGDGAPEADENAPVVSRRGDLWVVGPHKILCGDATAVSDYETLMAGEQAQMVFTDPPYNVPVQGHVSGLGKVQHREFAMASGEMTQGEFTAFLEAVFGNLARFSVDGAIHDYCMDWRHMEEVQAAAKAAGLALQNLCVWVKSNGGMGSLYRSRHELVFIYKNGTAPHINNVELGKNGRNRTNVWEYPGISSFGAARDEELAMHPTVKPVALVADALLDCSNRESLVLDVFAGSGTTLVAAESVGRRGRGIEIDPRYVDTIVRRMASVTSVKAVLAGSGLTFEEAAAARAAEGGAHG